MMNDTNAKIIVDHVSKSFSLDASKRSILSRLSALITGSDKRKRINAAEDVSFKVNAGEVLGLIGRNGAGKSTMLRLVAGIMTPQSGRISAPDSLIYISGFNHIIKPRLSMRENIYFAGSVLGLKGRDIRSKFEEIVEFSGLRDFLDVAVFQFSSGMVARLNFSILIHFASSKAADALLIDEVLHAGGDMEFDARASEKMRALIQNGAAVMIASHHMQDIENYCDRVIWMEHGCIKAEGSAKEVIELYRRSFVNKG